MPYPPGISRNDLKRAGIIDDRPVCDDCGERIRDYKDHAAGCPMEDLDGADLAELYHEQANSYDRHEL